MRNIKSKFYIAFFISILVMGIGYAAISTNLKIQGTAEISTNFDIYISNIREKTINQATTVTAEVAGKTTANFDVQLEKPGSYAEYDVTVKNDGNLDAVLKAVNGIEEANEKAPTDIQYSIKDLEENTPLLVGEEITFIVRVEFKSTATTVPTSNKQLTLWLDFEQSSGEVIPPIEPVNAVQLIQSKNVDGNTEGLNTDSTTDYNIRYSGAAPDVDVKNYVTFNHETWRIVGIFDGKIKIVRNDAVEKLAWNTSNINNWPTSSLATYLNGSYYNSMTASAKDMISDTTYYLGSLVGNNLYSAYELERGDTSYNCTVGSNGETSATCPRSTRWTGKIGLMYVSDYRYANFYDPNGYDLGNWMNDFVNQNYDSESMEHVWFMNHNHTESASAFALGRVNSSIGIRYGTNDAKITNLYKVYPVLHLKSNVNIVGGNGTSDQPYQLGM